MINKKNFFPIFAKAFFCFVLLLTAEEYQKLLEERQNICIPYLYYYFPTISMASSVVLQCDFQCRQVAGFYHCTKSQLNKTLELELEALLLCFFLSIDGD